MYELTYPSVVILILQVHQIAGYMNNAVETQVVQVPWLAQITLYHETYCFGAVVSNRIILTAAHCIVRDVGIMQSSLLVVRVGSNFARYGWKYYPSKFIFHSKYNSSADTYYNAHDIALILLTTQITFSTRVQKARIIPRGRDMREEDFSLSVAGWGSSGNSGYLPVKKLGIARMWPVPHKMCANWQISNGVQIPLPKHMSCMVADEWNGNCIPSGSVVMWDNYLVGIVSTGRDIVCGSNIMPSTYTDVTYFRNWITEYVEYLEDKDNNIGTGSLRSSTSEHIKRRNASEFHVKALDENIVHDTGNDLLPKWLSAALVP